MQYFIGFHGIDLIQWCTGRRIKEVFALDVAKVNKKWNQKDCISILAKLDNGAIGTIQISFSLPENFPSIVRAALEIVYSKYSGYLEFMDSGIKFYGRNYELPEVFLWPEVNDCTIGDLRSELEHFAKAILQGEKFLIKLDDIISAVNGIEAIFESLKTGKLIEVDKLNF